jgi:hypothetical protein
MILGALPLATVGMVGVQAKRSIKLSIILAPPR